MKDKIYGYIYLVTNNINGKKYVGLTTKTPEERFKAHLYRGNVEKSIFQKALYSYGKENFTLETIYVAFDKEELEKQEIYWISYYNTCYGHGYNLTEGGEGAKGHTSETRARISKSKTGKPNYKARGKVVSKEARLAISRKLGASRVKMTHLDTGEVIFLDYPTQGKELGFNPSLICAVIKGKRNHHKRYHCEYVNDANTEISVEVKTSSPS